MRELEKTNLLAASEFELAKARVIRLESELTKERERGIDQMDRLVAELDVSIVLFHVKSLNVIFRRQTIAQNAQQSKWHKCLLDGMLPW